MIRPRTPKISTVSKTSAPGFNMRMLEDRGELLLLRDQVVRIRIALGGDVGIANPLVQVLTERRDK